MYRRRDISLSKKETIRATGIIKEGCVVENEELDFEILLRFLRDEKEILHRTIPFFHGIISLSHKLLSILYLEICRHHS